MISDEERRKVANQLRSIPHVNYFGYDSINPHDLWKTIGFLRAVDGRILFSDVQRLADLIDRPAARNVAPAPSGHEPRAFTCELCGEWWPMDCGFAHCPNCGAEVER
mgnify:CR=1 FL=1